MTSKATPSLTSKATPSLPSLHAALSAPLGRKYSRAQSWRLGGSATAGPTRVELSFSEPDMVDSKPSAHAVYYDLVTDGSGLSLAAPPVQVPLGGELKLSHRAAGEIDLELRLLPSPAKDTELVAEVWGDGVRLARQPLGDKVGGKVLPAAVFGPPAFSPSGQRIAWVAERPFEAAQAPGYWAAEKSPPPTKPPPPPRDKFALRRGLGEALGVGNAVVVVWDWALGELSVHPAEDLIPAEECGPMTVPSSVIWDGSEKGIVFAAHHLPARGSGLVACLNRPTRLYHLPSLPNAAAKSAVAAAEADGDATASALAAATAAVSAAKSSGGAGGIAEAEAALAEAAAAAAAARSALADAKAQADADAAVRARCLTPGIYLAHLPKLSPDGRMLAFYAAAKPFAAHATALELRTLRWPPPDPEHAATEAAGAAAAGAALDGLTLLPVHRGAPDAADGWAGLCGFHAEHQAGGWLRPDVLALATIAAGERACFVCDTGYGPVAANRRRMAPPGWERGGGSVDLLHAAEGLIVVQCSNIATPVQVWACRVGPTAEADAWVQLADAATLRAPPAAALAPARAHVAAALAGTRIVTLTLPASAGGASGILALPPQASGERLPWVLRPHGGPHSVTTDEFAVQTALLLAAGVAVLQPNYRGSLSFGAAFGESLLGQVGALDVDDCGALARLALEQHADALDPERGGCYGGSHGGFLTAWLLGHPRHKDLFRCGVLWNPVTNLPSMVTVTDIPEWCFAECLPKDGPPLAWPLTPEQLAAMYAKSPISVVGNVRAPSLMLLGAADQRVPHSQGREWVAALQSQPSPPEVVALEYPGEGHAIAGAEQQAHAVQSAVSWLLEHTAARTAAEGDGAGN